MKLQMCHPVIKRGRVYYQFARMFHVKGRILYVYCPPIEAAQRIHIFWIKSIRFLARIIYETVLTDSYTYVCIINCMWRNEINNKWILDINFRVLEFGL